MLRGQRRGGCCIPDQHPQRIPTYLRSEVGAIATDASADKPGRDAEPEADRGKLTLSARESSGGSVVGVGVDSDAGMEFTISAAEGS